MDYEPQGTEKLRSLFKRCVTCPNTVPTCPSCGPNQSCVQVSRTCTTCESRQCVLTADAATAPAPTTSSGPNVGAIVGGVIAGVVVITLATYLVWRFCIKPRRGRFEEEYPEEYEDDKDPYENGYRPSGLARRSGHSVRSMASTVMTRASNVIQIAFIPDIRDRTNSDAPSIPPVPPVPLELAETQPATPYNAHPPSPYSDQASTDHYFLPQDLRQSRFSEFTDDSDSRSTRHYSIASSLARASFASGVYGHGTASPVQTAVSGKANVVSVSSSQRATPGGTIPEVPSVDYLKYGAQQASEKLTSGTTSPKDNKYPAATKQNLALPAHLLSSKSSATLVNNESPPTTIDAQAIAHSSTVPPLPTNFPSAATAGASSSRDPHSNTSASDVSETSQQKKSRRQSQQQQHQHLTAAIAEATRRASKQPTHGGLGSVPIQRSRDQSSSRRDPSPFSDDNEVVDDGASQA